MDLAWLAAASVRESAGALEGWGESGWRGGRAGGGSEDSSHRSRSPEKPRPPPESPDARGADPRAPLGPRHGAGLWPNHWAGHPSSPEHDVRASGGIPPGIAWDKTHLAHKGEAGSERLLGTKDGNRLGWDSAPNGIVMNIQLDIQFS